VDEHCSSWKFRRDKDGSDDVGAGVGGEGGGKKFKKAT
jgi:hypothetical protein